MRKHQFFSLADILEQVKLEQCTQDDFCLYGNDEGDLALDSRYLVSDDPDVVDDKDVSKSVKNDSNLNHKLNRCFCKNIRYFQPLKSFHFRDGVGEYSIIHAIVYYFLPQFIIY